MSGERLTRRQQATLFVVENNGLVAVSDVAMHAHASEAAERTRLAALELRGLVARQHTGHHRRSSFAYSITAKGSQVLAQYDTPEDPSECDLCGMSGGSHLRACIVNPDRRPRSQR